MDFAAAGLLDGLDGEIARRAIQLLEQLAATASASTSCRPPSAEDRLALLPVERVLGGAYTARRSSERTACPAELMIRIRRLLGLPRPGPTTACSPTRTSRPPSRSSCSSTPASPRRRSSRSRACSAKGMSRLGGHDHRGVRADVPAAGRHRGGGRAALRGDGRAADAGARAGARRGVQGPPARSVRRGMIGRAELERPARRRAGRSLSASPTSSASRASAARSSRGARQRRGSARRAGRRRGRARPCG